ncbi:MAG: phosphoribosylformylglycinamidine synthase subunit PurQ [Alphaproteobacteria bacterium]
MTAQALIIAGYGLNCEEETLHAFEYNGAAGNIIHINDLIDNIKILDQYQILAIPGGFSYGDDTGSGNAFAQKMKLALGDALINFIERDTLTIGICNGCQILANLGLVPALDERYGERNVAVTYNSSNRYQCRWIDIKTEDNNSPWLYGIDRMHIPVAHGEGRFIMPEHTLEQMQNDGHIAARYIKTDGTYAQEEFPYNPNGSMGDIAAMQDRSGRVLAIMPHPERGMFSWQRDDFDYLKDQAIRKGEKLTEVSDGMALFENAARYFECAKAKTA